MTSAFPPPAAQHCVVVGQDTAFSWSAVPEMLPDQLLPPLVVLMIVPVSPTAQHVSLAGQEMARSKVDVSRPDVWLAQVEPPSVVARMVLAAPTAKQAVAVGHEMPLRAWVLWNCVVQVAPPSAVATIEPEAPTAQHWVVEAQETLW
jgi:hypothetical protein